jgi:hypothetical protein
MNSHFRVLSLFSVAAAASTCSAQGLAAGAATPLRVGTLLQADFETASGWAKAAPVAVGTIDVAGSTQPSNGLRSSTSISSGPLAVRNGEANLGKLTLACSLSASAARPVQVLVESFDAAKKRTGAIETTIFPAAPDFHQRYALELASFRPVGAGRFAPTAPFLGLTFSIGGAKWKGVAAPEIRVDNLHLARPAFYVSAGGSDNNDGRSEATALPRRKKLSMPPVRATSSP